MTAQSPSSADNVVLGERIKLLFAFCAELIPEKEKIQALLGFATEQAGRALTVAPILGAFGRDYEEVHLEAQLRARRAKALYDLLAVLEDTEKERKEFQTKKRQNNENLGLLMNHLGIT